MFIEIAIVSVSVGAFLDGASTNWAIAKGNVEIDRIMVWIFGTNKPTAEVVYVRGGLTIALESLVAIIMSHWYPWFGVTLIGQAVYHCYAAYKNWTYFNKK
jgi:hypothetical protein